jgi:integron integrase
MTNQPPRKLLDQVRDAIRLKHYSLRTEDTYVEWIKRYILFHHKRHPKDMGVAEVEAFLTHLAVVDQVSASTQNQALSALLFLYRHVLNLPFNQPLRPVRAKRPERLPVVMTHAEALRVLVAPSGTEQLMAKLLYGAGLRLMECVRLRVKDLDFEQRQILVRDGKGEKDRVTMLPESLIAPLRDHLQRVQQIHQQDLAAGFGTVYLPYALAVKYPNAAREWAWHCAACFPGQKSLQ